MRLADDTRGRVPFAVVGVLILVGASTFAAGIETTGPAETNRAVDVTVDRVTASSSTALREAVHDAAREAALAPVTAPANTSVGRVIGRQSTFENALKLRIYVRTRAYLGATAHERQGVRTTASLQPTPDAAAVREALSRVRVERVDNGTALNVTVRNVSVRAVRDGRTVHAENRTLTVTAATPVTALHARARSYERRLNRGTLEGPGLGRQVTARLFAVTWARGYAQHGGAPVQQVLATRHVEVATNDALVRTQRATFGSADPAARRELRAAAVETGVTDLVAATPAGAETARWAWSAADATTVNVSNESVRVPSPDSSLPVTVGRAADRAAVHVVRAESVDNHSLAGALRQSHRARATLRTAVVRVESESRPSVPSPGSGWEQVDESERVTESVTDANGPLPEVHGERVAARFARRVEREHTASKAWVKGNRTRTTEVTWRETYRVGVAVVVEHAPNGGAPDRPTEPLFERGGALNGSNLDDAPERAREELIADQGGRDDVAAGVVTGRADTERAVYGARPENLSAWVRRDLVGLRTRVRAVSTNVSGTDLGTMRVNPAAVLAERLRDRRAALVDAPATYDGVADRARVAARARYVDSVIARLDERAEGFRRMKRAYNRSLTAEGNASLESLAARIDAGRNASGVGPRLVRGDIANATLEPHGSPAYLTTASVDHETARPVPRGRAYHPLTTRNVNLFTVPYGDAASAVSGTVVDDPERVRLGAAGRTLETANRTLRARPNASATLGERRDALQRAVTDALEPVERRAEETLSRTTALPPAARRRVVDDAGDRWTIAERARAAANGTLAVEIAATAGRRADLNGTERAQLESRLRLATADAAASRAATVPPTRVETLARASRRVAKAAVEESVSRAGERASERAAEKWVGEAFAAVPAGLPVLPPPYTWYATVNVWTVEIEGAYARFSIRTARDAPGGRLRYVRDGSTVTLDVDGDGDAERLGRNERMSFETTTAVFVVVPANGRGVGDRGIAAESSSGWPNPGCTAPLTETCPSE